MSIQMRCIYSNKDKNFKANHNHVLPAYALQNIVSIVTKIRILKQITTGSADARASRGCIYSNKDKNFKANHNCTNNIDINEVLYL